MHILIALTEAQGGLYGSWRMGVGGSPARNNHLLDMITDSYNLPALLPPAATIICLLLSTIYTNGCAIIES